MSIDRDPAPSVVARRPPAPSGDLATVTRLLAGGDEREVVPVAAVDGSLALDVRARPAVPPAPDLRLLDGGGESTARCRPGRPGSPRRPWRCSAVTGR